MMGMAMGIMRLMNSSMASELSQSRVFLHPAAFKPAFTNRPQPPVVSSVTIGCNEPKVRGSAFWMNVSFDEPGPLTLPIDLVSSRDLS